MFCFFIIKLPKAFFENRFDKVCSTQVDPVLSCTYAVTTLLQLSKNKFVKVFQVFNHQLDVKSFF